MGLDTLADTKTCRSCDTAKPLSEFHVDSYQIDGRHSLCAECKNTKVNAVFNAKHNPQRMYVNGKYVPSKHPLYKAGRYESFNDAAFDSLQNYSKCPSGEVYIITNPAWGDQIKVGKAIDAVDRLNSYQTSSPYRDYRLEWKVTVTDRTAAETAAHTALEKVSERSSEWFRIDVPTAIKIIEGDMLVQTLVK
jgi:hypothetical protein